MVRKRKNFRLPDHDVQLLEKIRKEFEEKGLQVSEADVISFSLRALEKEGGAMAYLAKGAKHGKKKSA